MAGGGSVVVEAEGPGTNSRASKPRMSHAMSDGDDICVRADTKPTVTEIDKKTTGAADPRAIRLALAEAMEENPSSY